MPFGSLWLAVLASTVAVFILSSIMHALLKYHGKDFGPVSDEDALSQAVTKQGLAEGQFMVPHCGHDGAKFKDPAFKDRWAKGPNFMLILGPSGLPSMGKALGLWALNCFIVSFLTAYVARHSLDFCAGKADVVRIVGTVAFMGYGLATLTESTWKWRPWRATILVLFDAAVYAAATAACFALLWPCVME